MIQITGSRPIQLTAADDAQRMFLICILYDATYLHFDAMAACPACCAPGVNTCAECWIPHREPVTRYGRLSMDLGEYQGTPEGTAYPLTIEDHELLADALAEAISYRQVRASAEDRALLAAYRALATSR